LTAGSAYTGSISSPTILNQNDLIADVGSLYLSSLYLGAYGGFEYGRLQAKDGFTNLYFNDTQIAYVSSITSSIIGLGSAGYISSVRDIVSSPNLLNLVSTPNLLNLVSTPNLLNVISSPNLLSTVVGLSNVAVTRITAGTNISISPVGGIGNVTINATGGGVTSIPFVSAFTVSTGALFASTSQISTLGLAIQAHALYPLNVQAPGIQNFGAFLATSTNVNADGRGSNNAIMQWFGPTNNFAGFGSYVRDTTARSDSAIVTVNNTNTQTLVFFSSVGNVGIGTTALQNYRLNIRGTGTSNGLIVWHAAGNNVPYMGFGYHETFDSLVVGRNVGSNNITTFSSINVSRTTGFVGINNSPQYTLHVNGAIAAETSSFIRGPINGSARLLLGPNSGGVNYDYCSMIQSCNTFNANFGSELSFWTHGNAATFGDPTRAMTINQAQQVGVNYASPAYPLDVGGIVKTRYGGSGTSGQGYFMADSIGNIFSGRTRQMLMVDGTGISTGIYFEKGANNNFAGLHFYTTSNLNTVSTLILDGDTGFVGVNCNTPVAQLDVNGLTQVSSMFIPPSIGRKIVLWAANQAAALNGTYYGFEIQSGELRNTVDSATNRLTFGWTNASKTFTEWVRMTNGNVGIGCNVPGVTLDVAGTARSFSTVTSSITLGLGAGWVQANAIQAVALSSIQVNSALGYISSLYIGSTTTIMPGYTLWANGPSRIQRLLIGQPSTVLYQQIANTGTDLQMIRAAAAMQPLATTWLTTSDKRIKENIVNADLDRCYNDLKNISLRRYSYISSFFTAVEGTDRHVLGFIAQEVSTLIPKSVLVGEAYGFSNFQYLNIDQLNMSLYGAVKKTIADKEVLESTVKGQRVEIQTLQGVTSIIMSTLEGLQGR
jgi:hypothetical protein